MAVEQHTANPPNTPLTKEAVLSHYAEVFQGAEKMEGHYHLELEEGAVPVVHPPRKVLVALKTN